MIISAIQFAGLEMSDNHTDGMYDYTLRARFRAMSLEVDRLQVVDGLPLSLMEQNGYQVEARIDLHYPESADGGGPSMEVVGTAAMQWLGAELAARQNAWIGAQITAEVVMQEVE